MVTQTGQDFLYEVKSYYTSLLNCNKVILIPLYKCKLKQSLYRLIIGSDFPEVSVSGFQISRKLAREVGKVFGPSHQPPLPPPLPPGHSPGIHFC